jgi:hypothetical protein
VACVGWSLGLVSKTYATIVIRDTTAAGVHGLRATHFEGERNQQSSMDGDARLVRPQVTHVTIENFQTGREPGRR